MHLTHLAVGTRRIGVWRGNGTHGSSPP
jgi:hypothetical protein